MPENEREGAELDLDTQIGIALGLGFSKPETAKAVHNRAYPAGISERSVFNHIKAAGGYIEEVAKFTAGLIREKRVAVAEIKASDVRQSLEKLLGASLKTLEDAILDGDVAAARDVLDRVMGKATQTSVNLMHGRIDHVHVHQMPAEVASAMDRLIASGQVPLGLLPAAQEAEVVGEA